ncbi:DUF1682 family protein [Heterostelium album PN500]|uniref:DUF1682 family protein n=1 Tax=Heterostelium pallidum (strain ATCC 26659 / Pp 5 / PN500) TaxID=670386 RepID=D3AVZ9_HETP5|nr:DUF1682 family protein [Heterostelium album PN500]EFA86472.1 DUF1682 family protein [Heterostelium album PN500]|eukprot:XP_020438577.1 DUF1682 family protein [Heterostelium album PN500]
MKLFSKTSILLLVVLISTLLISLSYSQVNIGNKHMVEYDEDEFEGVDHYDQSGYANLNGAEEDGEATGTTEDEEGSGESTTNKPTETEKPAAAAAVKKQTNYYMEIGFIIFIACYIVNYFIGKRTNQELVTVWGRRFRKTFESNFSFLGDKESYVIVKVDPNTYTFTCTGRINCQGALVTITLKKRQDLFSVIFDLVGYADPDRVTIEVAMNNEVMEPMIFAVIKNKALKSFRENNNDIELFASKQTPPLHLNDSYTVLGDTECLPSLLLKPEVVSVLNKYESYFESMHFTDHSLINPKYPKTLSFSYKLPKIKDIDNIHQLTLMSMYFIDYIASASLPKNIKAEKLREKQREAVFKQTHLERQEAAQKKKYEKEQKEKEKIAKLTPEEQRKRDEKEYKKELKKKQQKGRVIIG